MLQELIPTVCTVEQSALGMTTHQPICALEKKILSEVQHGLEAGQKYRGNYGDNRGKRSPLPWSLIEAYCQLRRKNSNTINNC